MERLLDRRIHRRPRHFPAHLLPCLRHRNHPLLQPFHQPCRLRHRRRGLGFRHRQYVFFQRGAVFPRASRCFRDEWAPLPPSKATIRAFAAHMGVCTFVAISRASQTLQRRPWKEMLKAGTQAMRQDGASHLPTTVMLHPPLRRLTQFPNATTCSWDLLGRRTPRSACYLCALAYTAQSASALRRLANTRPEMTRG